MQWILNNLITNKYYTSKLINIIKYLSWVDTFLAGYQVSSRMTGYCDIKKKVLSKNYNSNRVGPYDRPNIHMYLCKSVCTTTSVNLYELLLTYCQIKNLRNYALVWLFKGILVVKYKRLDWRISGRIILKSILTGSPAQP